MANTIIEAPIEVTKTAVLAAANGGRLAINAGEGLIHRVQPGYLPPELVAQQAVLKEFENRLGIVDLIDKDSPESELEVQAYLAADAMVDEGLVDQHTIVELRPVLSEDALGDPVLNERRERAVELLQLAFEEDHNVMAIPNTHPIMPSKHQDSPIDIESAWRVLIPELDGLERQLKSDREHEPAMLAITSPAYARAMFGGHATVTGDPWRGKLLVLEHVGERPEENRLAVH